MKYTVYTTAAEDYMNDPERSLIMDGYRQYEPIPVGWAKVGEVEFTPATPDFVIREAAVNGLDWEMKQRREDFTRGMEDLQRRKEELLAITHQPEVES